MAAAATPVENLSAAEWRARARTVFNNGEFFRAFDLAQAGLSEHPDDLKLAHRAVLSLANAGATEMAAAKFAELGLDRVETVDILSLRGRIAKDRAFARPPPERPPLFDQAASHYEAAYNVAHASGSAESYYPAINAASLALLAGHEKKAALRGREVLDLLGARIAAARTGDTPDRYWVLATAIEAYLLTDDAPAAGSLVGAAVAASGLNSAELSSTWRQLERILAAKMLQPGALAEMAPAEIVHFLGHIISTEGEPGRFRADEEDSVARDIDRALGGLRMTAAYGALAAGADIMLAEALLKRDVALHVILPFEREEFIALSVRPSGEHWVARFEACEKAASSVRYATEDQYLGDDHLYTYGGQIAMGLAVLYARHLHSGPRQIAVWDGEASAGVAGTAVDMIAWRKAGLAQTIIRCGPKTEAEALPQGHPWVVAPGRRDSQAMLFGDIKGFSKLTDQQLPSFTREVMGRLGRVIAGFRDKIAMVNTWGDGIFVVFPDAGAAAHCALAMQAAMGAIDLAGAGLPPDLSLRLGGHLGPVYQLTDPILNRPNYYGAHVSRAARIEPIVPDGCVYVTETFAAVLALYNAEELACDYVGWTDMAKKYGRLRMFLLRHRDSAPEPKVLGDIERPPVPG